ncbi:hypothetical protein KSP40_PGU004855 [Platanthera guangdongensis]|uniref:Uncharacterized protein n=1 Tax=Platanthera guangdongensis TaxID=2320717 RepID=A0ABR2MFN7_9ASPA
MEGLIPFLLRALKRKKATRYYRCISSGAAEGSQEEGRDYYFLVLAEQNRGETRKEFLGGRRRQRSMEELSGKPFLPEKPSRLNRESRL